MAGVPYDKRVVDVDLYRDIYDVFHPEDPEEKSRVAQKGLLRTEIISQVGRDLQDWKKISQFLSSEFLLTTKNHKNRYGNRWLWNMSATGARTLAEYEEWCQARMYGVYELCVGISNTALRQHLTKGFEYVPDLAWYYEIDRLHFIRSAIKKHRPQQWWDRLVEHPEWRVWPFGVMAMPAGAQVGRMSILMEE